ncbi:hypothetical protein RT717_01335 [Imperialibacter roseus]|uniref:Uncharacterized protein n=1 Tax=Imperialibacter roseus TaxID=1324217 RepID=A0ABZ0IQJ2_9BACT|nr:hypothetical protein [Imperialibacter roseus]WOK07264.1 hypothetical protein RT717_01335 [Imperialibacter roseus]
MQRFRQKSAILLSMLVLFSSMSFNFSMHFCMGQLESIALFQQAKPCEMVTQPVPCVHDHHDQECELNHTHTAKKGCCEDHFLQVEGQDELARVAAPVSMPDFHMVAVLYALVSFIFSAPTVDYYSYKDYSPPLIERDIPVLVQSFLI